MFLILAAGVLLPAVVLSAENAVVNRPEPVYVSGGKADQAEGRQALAELRSIGIAGDYWLEFTLRVMPHNGAERTVSGQIFGRRNSRGPLTRLSLAGPDGPQSWLIQSGPQPEAWLSDASARSSGARAVTAAETFAPVAGTDLTLFDLQMPFLYWEDFAFEGIAKVRSRPAYSFLLYPPAELAAVRPGLGAVRVALDTQFHALVQAELLDPKGRLLKSIAVLDLKKTGEQWLVKSIDLRNLATRDKTRIEFNAVALNLALPDTVFAPGTLDAPAALPDGTKTERF